LNEERNKWECRYGLSKYPLILSMSVTQSFAGLRKTPSELALWACGGCCGILQLAGSPAFLASFGTTPLLFSFMMAVYQETCRYSKVR